jgi:Trk K+ transport system NAD-binding subunit
LTVPATFVARELKGIGTPEDVIVAAILRGDHAIVPRGDDRIEPSDRILVFCTRAAAGRVQAYFSGGRA